MYRGPATPPASSCTGDLSHSSPPPRILATSCTNLSTWILTQMPSGSLSSTKAPEYEKLLVLRIRPTYFKRYKCTQRMHTGLCSGISTEKTPRSSTALGAHVSNCVGGSPELAIHTYFVENLLAATFRLFSKSIKAKYLLTSESNEVRLLSELVGRDAS